MAFIFKNCSRWDLYFISILVSFEERGLTGGKYGGDDVAPQGSGDGLQAHCVLSGGAELIHVVWRGCGAEDDLLKQDNVRMLLTWQYTLLRQCRMPIVTSFITQAGSRTDVSDFYSRPKIIKLIWLRNKELFCRRFDYLKTGETLKDVEKSKLFKKLVSYF